MKPYVKIGSKMPWWDELDKTRKGRKLQKKSRRSQLKKELTKELKKEREDGSL